MASGKNAAPHVSTSLAKNLRQALDEENSDCDIFGTRNYNILLGNK